MGRIGFRIRSRLLHKEIPVYVYMYDPRGRRYECKTGFFVVGIDWVGEKQRAKTDKHINFDLNEKLDQLRHHLLRKINAVQGSDANFDRKWLRREIAHCFQRDPRDAQSTLLYHAEHYGERSVLRRSPVSGSLGLKESSGKNLLRFYEILSDYEKLNNRVSYLDEIDEQWIFNFIRYLKVDKDYSINGTSLKLKLLRAILNDARRQGYKVHPYSLYIKAFRMSDQDRRLITLDFNEIEKIKQLEGQLPPELIPYWSWMLIGLYTGQRATDLLRITADHIRIEKNQVLIDILQQKTNQFVTVGVIDPLVVRLLTTALPPPITRFQFNLKIKLLCKLAKIDQLVEGYKLEPKILRKKLGIYPKYQLIASHDLRRSFATNYYGRVPTPILMQITGHTRESTFLQYVNKRTNKDVFAFSFIESLEQLKNQE